VLYLTWLIVIAIESKMLVSLIVLSTVATFVYGQGQNVELSFAEKQEFVSAHNEWRILTGANNMRKLKWNDELAKLAQAQTSTCFNPKPNDDLAGFNYLGENYFGTFQYHPSPRSVVDEWGMEFVEYDLETNTCENRRNVQYECDHFKQVAKAEASDIGCAMVFGCDRNDYGPKYEVYCSYGQSKKNTGAPYEVGTPGSKCQELYGEVADQDGLCVPKPKTPSQVPTTQKPATPKCEDSTRVCKVPLISVMCKLSSFTSRCPKTCGAC